MYSGPLPDPETLSRYRSVHPDLPEIIVGEMRAESAHRREMAERDMAVYEQDAAHARELASRGQALGFVIALVLIVVGVVLAVAGLTEVAVAVFGLGIAQTIGVFITGRSKGTPEPK